MKTQSLCGDISGILIPLDLQEAPMELSIVRVCVRHSPYSARKVGTFLGSVVILCGQFQRPVSCDG